MYMLVNASFEPSRRRFLAGAAAIALVPLAAVADSSDTSVPFSFDIITEAARDRATRPPEAQKPVDSVFADLDYDAYQLIEFRRDRMRWDEPDMSWRLIPFHMGWLFKLPVRLHEVTGDKAKEMTFTTADFNYRGKLKDIIPPNTVLPGVAGFKLTHPLNRADKLDEVISFIGASYFRALGQGNTYGSSARGLAVNSGLTESEEFPIFTEFWIEKPATGATDVATIYASLDSDSVTGAYRFVLRPGVDTTIEVTARLFLRKDVDQIGIAPLTSMFLYDDVNRAAFDDFRPQVHDCNGLRIERENGDVIWRALDNPAQLSSSYYTETRPRRFGLRQRGRDFAQYQDASARYDLRPSVDVEPMGDWGKGTVRLFELPSDLEVHDNIGAFWVPDTPAKAGDALEFAYRLHWGRLEPEQSGDLAMVWATRVGKGGPSGMENPDDTRKFVVDFKGGMLGRMPEDDTGVAPVANVSGGTVDVITLSKLPEDEMWRLVMDIKADSGALVEMTAHIAGYGRKLTETWSFQWRKP